MLKIFFILIFVLVCGYYAIMGIVYGTAVIIYFAVALLKFIYRKFKR